MTVVDRRSFTRALTGGAGLRRRLYAWDRELRMPLATALRVGVVQLDSGVGATTVANALGAGLAAHRTQPVLAVDLAGGARSLGLRLGVGATPVSAVRSRARTSAEAADGLVRAQSGQYVFCPTLTESDSLGIWTKEVAPIVRFFDVVVTDFGARHPLVDLAATAAMCDVVCLVAGAGRADAEVGASMATAITGLAEHPQVVLTLVDRRGDSEAAARVVARHASVPVAVLPFDRGLRLNRPASGLSARAALLELGATVLGPAPATQEVPQ